MATNFPNGYGNRRLSLDDLRAEHEARMHPEFARRLFACIEEAGGLVGIGNGWRSRETQEANFRRAPNTFAPPGLSFHESHRFTSGLEAYAAVDSVGRDARHDEAWDWMRDHAGRFGLRTFWNVNGEPWHTQCNDIPNGVSTWTKAGCPDPGGFRVATAPPLGDGANRTITGDVALAGGPPTLAPYGLHQLNDDKPVLQLGWHGDLVEYIQRVILDKAGGRIAVDGDFGPKTDARVRDVQAFVSLPVTGIVDWNGTWQFIDMLAGNVPSSTAGRSSDADPDPTASAFSDTVVVDSGWYWVQRGDAPWPVAERVYGHGTEWQRFEPTDPPSPGFTAPDHAIRLPGVRGLTTVVRPGDRVWSIVARLRPEANPPHLFDRFYALNGGPHRTLHPGDVVFLDVP